MRANTNNIESLTHDKVIDMLQGGENWYEKMGLPRFAELINVRLREETLRAVLERCQDDLRPADDSDLSSKLRSAMDCLEDAFTVVGDRGEKKLYDARLKSMEREILQQFGPLGVHEEFESEFIVIGPELDHAAVKAAIIASFKDAFEDGELGPIATADFREIVQAALESDALTEQDLSEDDDLLDVINKQASQIWEGDRKPSHKFASYMVFRQSLGDELDIVRSRLDKAVKPLVEAAALQIWEHCEYNEALTEYCEFLDLARCLLSPVTVEPQIVGSKARSRALVKAAEIWNSDEPLTAYPEFRLQCWSLGILDFKDCDEGCIDAMAGWIERQSSSTDDQTDTTGHTTPGLYGKAIVQLSEMVLFLPGAIETIKARLEKESA